MASKAFKAPPPANKLLDVLFEKCWKVAYPKVRAMHDGGARPHAKWIHEDTEMARQLKALQS